MSERDSATLPGRLGNPNLTMTEDPRLDPRVAQLLANMPADAVAATVPPVTEDSSYEECLDWVAGMEAMLASQHAAELAAMPDFPDVISTIETIEGEDGNAIDLYIDQPVQALGPRPCVVHMHGGGMAFTEAQAPSSQRWRKSMASQGLLVVGIQFRNGGGALGNHPFPAGLNDCASAVRWVHAQRTPWQVSSLIITGESGGGNLVAATAIKANMEGWIEAIDGVFAIAPQIFGYYGSIPPELLSWQENEGYQGTLGMTRAMSRVYDPEHKHQDNPQAWPYQATPEVLRGLPPHIITNYELDLIRDDGVIYAKKLQAAGVAAFSRTITGAIHVVDLAMPDLVPELFDETLSSIAGFARRMAARRG
jgi:acetyl esterase/lipase